MEQSRTVSQSTGLVSVADGRDSLLKNLAMIRIAYLTSCEGCGWIETTVTSDKQVPGLIERAMSHRMDHRKATVKCNLTGPDRD